MKQSIKGLIIIALFCSLPQLWAQKKPLPNYDLVFPENRVNKLEIKIKKADWDSIGNDMKKKFKTEFGKSPMPKLGPPPAGGNFPPNFLPKGTEKGMLPMPIGSDDEPRYVEADILFNGRAWHRVGFRLKGNSSLMSSWGQGIYKIPFRLNFDKFTKEDFFGFTELSMSPAFHDNSLIREKLATDLFRKSGIPSARTAFYQIYIDYGKGLQYVGIYTMVEVIDDTMVKTQFGDDKGNIYKPESTFQRFDEKQFDKKNHKKQKDWSDVQAFVAALNDSTRKTNVTTWRQNLEKTFDVNHFLKWLAINTAITNWDTYGAMAHNHYLYNAPNRGLVWIPWDNNEAISDNTAMKMPFPKDMPPMPDGNKMPLGRGLSLSLDNVPNHFILIKYLAEDKAYYAKYLNYIKEFREKNWNTNQINSQIDEYAQLLRPYVIGTKGEKAPYSHLQKQQDFQEGIEALKKQVLKRTNEIDQFLKQPNSLVVRTSAH